MTKFEQAIADAQELPPDLQAQLSEELLHKVHSLLALRDDLMIGIRQLDAGDYVDGVAFLKELRERHGA